MIELYYILANAITLWIIYKSFVCRHSWGDYAPGVSILVAAYNEVECIEDCINSVLQSNYTGDIEVIAVDDGSTDGTYEVLQRIDDKRLRIVRQSNRGKASALNCALGLAQYPIVITIDADSRLNSNAIREIVKPLQDDSIVAVGGNVKITNGYMRMPAH